MQVTKRDGRIEAYDRQKIARAMGKALAETADPVASDASALEALLARVEQALVATGATEVEQIQDLVERTLMETGHYDAAKADRKSTRLNSSHIPLSRMPSSA